jgi:hypothetical protein
LRNRRLEILYFEGTTAHLDAVNTRTQEDVTPLNYGIGAPIDQQIRDRQVRYDGEHELGSRKLPRLTLSGGKQTDVVWMDPEHGFNPVRVETYFPPEKTPHVVTELSDFREFSEGRWVAFLQRQVVHSEKPTPFMVLETKVLEFDCEAPAEAQLRLQIRPGTWISNYLSPGHRGFQTRTGVVSLDNFREDGTLTAGSDDIVLFAGGASSPIEPTTMTDPTLVDDSWFASGWRFAFVVSLLLVVAASGIYVVIRRSRN